MTTTTGPGRSTATRTAATVLGTVLAVELGVLVWLTRFDSNEGWYTLYPAMLLHGQLPYRDFFYHRLPLLPFLFVAATPLPMSMLVSARVLCAVCAWWAWWLSAATVQRWTASPAARHWVLVFAVTSFYGNSYLITAQSYAPFALCVAAAIWMLSAPGRAGTRLRAGAAGVLLAMAMALRFGPDPMVVVVPAALLVWVVRRNENAHWPLVAGAFVLVIVAVFAISASWDAESFVWGVLVWPFQMGTYIRENVGAPPPSTLDAMWRYVAIKIPFVADLTRSFLAVLVVFAVGLIGLFLQGGSVQQWLRVRKGVELFAWAILGANAAFFFAPANSGVMQYAFVLPLAAVCGVAFAREAFRGLAPSPRVSAAVLAVVVAVLAAFGLVGQTPISCTLRSPGVDVRVLDAVARRVKSAVPNGKYVVTFDPVLAADAGVRAYPGLEFELFGFFPKWDTSRAKRLNVLNWPMLRNALLARDTGAVVLSDRRWLDREGMGRLLAPYRAEILRTLDASDLARTQIAMPSCVGVGSVTVYTRRSESTTAIE